MSVQNCWTANLVLEENLVFLLETSQHSPKYNSNHAKEEMEPFPIFHVDSILLLLLFSVYKFLWPHGQLF